MQKLVKRISLVMVALMTVFTALSYVPAKAATVVPQVQFVGEQKLEYTAGERITFNLNAANYGGRVQYRVVLWNDSTKSYGDLWNTADKYYTNWMPYGNETLPLGWVINEPGTYRITVYAKRAGLANSQTALKGMNCDSYLNGPAFVVKPAFTATSLEAYEKAPLTTLEEVAAAEALRQPAVDSVAKVTDATLKAGLDARVAAADKKVAEAKEKLGYVHVESVKALTATTIKVVFDKEVSAGNMNFNISKKDDAYAINFIEKVSVSKNVATITLLDALKTKTNYVVEVKDVKTADSKLVQKEAVTKEFAYATTEPAKIVFGATKVTAGNDLTYKILDAEGNDITADFEDAVVTVETSDVAVVDTDLSTALPAGKTTAYSVVNVSLDDYELETGNTIITVVDTQLVLASLGRFTVDNGTFAKPVTYVYESDTAKKLSVEVLDQNGDTFAGATLTYKSLSTTVALVDTDGTIRPLSTGTASILVTATSGDLTVRKTVSIAVKADPKATSIKLSATSAKLVRDSAIDAEIDVQILDQYGEVFEVTHATDLTYTIDKTGIATGLTKGTPVSEALTDGEATITLTPYDSTDAASVKSTAKLTVAYKALRAYVSLSVVDPAAFAGYAAVINTTKLDMNDNTSSKYYDADLQSATVTVYEKDVNGNYIALVDASRVSVVKADTAKTNVAIDPAFEMTPAKVGTESVIVKVEDTKVATFAITVVNTTPVVTTVTQVKSAVQISLAGSTTLQEALFGTDEDGKAFVAYDQYGAKIQITLDDIQAIAADNTAVVVYSVSSGTVTDLDEGAKGTATLTLKIADKFYTVNVKVVD